MIVDLKEIELNDEFIKTEILKYYPEFIKVHGPYLRKDKRKHIILCSADSKIKRTISWPKAKMEVKLKRNLIETETVDHIDADLFNDSYLNLQILTRIENIKKDVKRMKEIVKNCIWCGSELQLTKNQVNNRSKNDAGPFCGKQCSGEYGKAIQLGGDKMGRTKINVKYYYNNSDRK